MCNENTAPSIKIICTVPPDDWQDKIADLSQAIQDAWEKQYGQAPLELEVTVV